MDLKYRKYKLYEIRDAELKRIDTTQKELLPNRDYIEYGPDTPEKLRQRQTAYVDGFYAGFNCAVWHALDIESKKCKWD